MQLEDGRITILASPEKVDIEIRDHSAAISFVRVRMTPEQWATALSRLAYTTCDVHVRGLERVGLTMENRAFTFPLPEGTDYKDQKERAIEEVEHICPEGWEPDLWFNSQDSFYKLEGWPYARTTIRRWV